VKFKKRTGGQVTLAFSNIKRNKNAVYRKTDKSRRAVIGVDWHRCSASDIHNVLPW